MNPEPATNAQHLKEYSRFNQSKKDGSGRSNHCQNKDGIFGAQIRQSYHCQNIDGIFGAQIRQSYHCQNIDGIFGAQIRRSYHCQNKDGIFGAQIRRSYITLSKYRWDLWCSNP